LKSSKKKSIISESKVINPANNEEIKVVDVSKTPDYETIQKAKTTRALAIFLISLLAGSVILHYGFTAWMLIIDKTAVVTGLDRIFIAWLPVVSGLASSAVTYYFTREKR